VEEKYFVNGNKKKPYTWKELLNWCYKNINGLNSRDYYEEYNNNINNYYNVNNFFKSFRNNPNDGDWTGGGFKGRSWHQHSYKVLTQIKDENGRLTSKWEYIWKFGERYYKPAIFIPKKYQVTDSYGRIIPSGYIKECYLKFKPIDEPYYPLYNRYRGYDHDRDFRKAPVPRMYSFKNGNWKRYGNNRGSGKCWKREWYAARVDRKEIIEEYNISYKLPDQIPYKYGYWIKKSWKRTKKEHQWERINTGFKKVDYVTSRKQLKYMEFI
jgi:hypothetical protein